MGDKVDYQHGGEADGKTFPAQTAIKSPAFGVEQRTAEVTRGNIPGSSQWEPLSPDTETP